MTQPLRALAAALVPPLCAACGDGCDGADVVCERCAAELRATPPLAGDPPQGVDACWCSAPHHGVARDLVVALKFRRLLPVAELMAERIALLAPAGTLAAALVPVPPAPARLRRRGFDPAGELAAALEHRLTMPSSACLERRGSGRQMGRRRAERVAAPPRILPRAAAPESAVLVDDVLTTGATVSACAAALRAAGAVSVGAVAFARKL